MNYKIAVATSDGVNVDQSFGAATVFQIYTVTDSGYQLSGKREYREVTPVTTEECTSGCGSGGGCGCGHGCGGAVSPKVDMLSDVRCLLCSKIGFQAQKQFEKKAITTFDISCGVTTALDRITGYFARIDRHQSLRGWRQNAQTSQHT